MTKTFNDLQELRKKIYAKAKAEPKWRFWGLYVHVCKEETLKQAYKFAKENKGASGIDGITFEQVEAKGVQTFLSGIRDELVRGTYKPSGNKAVEIPKGNGKTRKLLIPTIKDRVVQGALKQIIEPIFEADFQEGSYGYRPKRSAHQAIKRVAEAAIRGKTTVLDIDLKGYFDNIRHHILLEKVAKRVKDPKIMRLIKQMIKAGGKRGVAQGSVIGPLLANIYLNDIDKMLEAAKTKTRDKYIRIDYARYSDDLVILVDGHRNWSWLREAILRRIREELSKLQVEINEEKTREVSLLNGESFGFLGFNYRRVKTKTGRWGVRLTPKLQSRTKLLKKIKAVFKRHRSQPIQKVIRTINPILNGWVNYFRVGQSKESFDFVREWTEKKVRRHLMRAKMKKGFGWKRWSNEWLVKELGLFNDYQIRYLCS